MWTLAVVCLIICFTTKDYKQQRICYAIILVVIYFTFFYPRASYYFDHNGEYRSVLLNVIQFIIKMINEVIQEIIKIFKKP
jgi:hypothetical protein